MDDKEPWSRRVALGSIDPSSNPGSPIMSILFSVELKLLSAQFVGCAQDEPLRGLTEEAWRNAAKALKTAPWMLDKPIWTTES